MKFEDDMAYIKSIYALADIRLRQLEQYLKGKEVSIKPQYVESVPSMLRGHRLVFDEFTDAGIHATVIYTEKKRELHYSFLPTEYFTVKEYK